MASEAEKLSELSAIVQAVRDRVRARYPEPGTAGDPSGIQVQIADLMPIVHARDAAQAKIAAIGSVNPRAGGLVNSIIQTIKKTVARSLQWFVRDQVIFNREMVAALETVIEALNEHNRSLVSLASQTSELSKEARDLKDIRHHWLEWRVEWERKLAANEVQFLRNTADLQGAFQHRSTLMELNFRDIARAQHQDYLGAIDRATIDIQKRLWTDLQNMRAEFDRLIHDELRIIRMRAPAAPSRAIVYAPIPQAAAPLNIDYTRFAYRFRGSEEYVRRTHEVYRPYFAGCRDVLDIGCGRGEFLQSLKDWGVNARGIDLGEESVAQCREKGLNAEVADLFLYLTALPDGEFDGIFSSQVVEHLEPARLPDMIRLCASKLRRGGVLAIETPNPECLAIFATYFYLDPTHTRPVPHPLIAFYMEEYGMGGVEVHKLAPAEESWPEIGELPKDFRERFFGGLDYAIFGRRL
jgi:2-polyprenyl-3-methyl-5-hydroxy-6-metoxy-1,4-benzoquinol methylase